MSGMRQRCSGYEICKDKTHTAVSDERLPGAGPSSAEITAKEYGDAGRLDDIFLVLPELQERSCGAEE